MKAEKYLPLIPYPQNVKFLSGESRILSADKLNYTDYSPLMKSGDYSLIIKNGTATAFAADDMGRFYALQTFRQLIKGCGGFIPDCEIVDKPAFSYRGFMLDCARHTFSIDEIKKIIDVASQYKMNYFHWHLSDDQGFRIESEKYPKLCKIGSVRKKSAFGNVKDDKEYGGFFTKSEISEIVEFCHERFIEVVPEIDVPGHTTAMLASYPFLSCDGKDYEVAVKQGIYPDVLCVGKQSTYEFVFDLIDELIPLFGCCYFHIGGDEVPRIKWHECPDCRKAIKDNGLNDENDLQGLFTKKIAKHLKMKGKTAIVWNDTLKCSNIGTEDVVVQFWMEKGSETQEFALNGGKYINSDFYHWYMDYPYGMTPLKKAYNYNPYLTKDKDALIGIETPVWTEYIDNNDRLEYMIFPRLFAAAENAWTLQENKNYKRFENNLVLLFYNSEIKQAPKKDWNMPLTLRLGDTLSFFCSKIDRDLIKKAINNKK